MKYPPSTKPGESLKNKTGNWRTFRPIFLHDKCTACGICDNVCPEGIIYATGKTNAAGKNYRDCDLDYCKGCGLCAKNCPFAAIRMEREEK
ncbi:MAG: 4Fe-4S binding protein [Patescibacteria group bacterium]|jgi:pyruvate ferredoxin oxidoreductase delta subunit